MLKTIKLQRKINTLQNEIDELNDLLRAQIVNQVIKNYDKIDKYYYLLEENKRLRLKIKILKERND